MEAYIKYNYFHMEQRLRFKPDPFKAENFYYNEEQRTEMHRTGSRVRTNKIQYGLQTFRHFGKDKVFMDFSFFAIAFKIKKMCAKMRKEGLPRFE